MVVMMDLCLNNLIKDALIFYIDPNFYQFLNVVKKNVISFCNKATGFKCSEKECPNSNYV